MKKAQSVALIGAGSFTDSPVARFWWLSERLGPVKASSYRIASRIANRLRAGHAVRDYREIDSCNLILVSVPDQSLPRIVAEMAAAKISWRGKAVVLCSNWLDAGDLDPLAARGAAVGSISTIPGFDDPLFLLEGDKPAIQESRRLVECGSSRAVAIARCHKPLYLAALTCTGGLMFALLLAASESLRHAGVPSPVSAAVLEKQLSRSLRSYVRGRRRAYPQPRELSRQLRALSLADPALAAYVEQSCRLAAHLLKTNGAQAKAQAL